LILSWIEEGPVEGGREGGREGEVVVAPAVAMVVRGGEGGREEWRDEPSRA